MLDPEQILRTHRLKTERFLRSPSTYDDDSIDFFDLVFYAQYRRLCTTPGCTTCGCMPFRRLITSLGAETVGNLLLRADLSAFHRLTSLLMQSGRYDLIPDWEDTLTVTLLTLPELQDFSYPLMDEHYREQQEYQQPYEAELTTPSTFQVADNGEIFHVWFLSHGMANRHELFFDKPPSDGIRDQLTRGGWRWSERDRCWYMSSPYTRRWVTEFRSRMAPVRMPE